MQCDPGLSRFDYSLNVIVVLFPFVFLNPDILHENVLRIDLLLTVSIYSNPWQEVGAIKCCVSGL